MPLVWDAGNLFSPARIPSLLLTIQKRDPDLLIFKKGDYTGMGLAAFYITTSEAYQRINNFSELTVYSQEKREIACPRISEYLRVLPLSD